MLGALRSSWATMPRDRDLPVHVQAILAGPLFARLGSLLIGQLGPLGVGLVAILRIGGPWPVVLLVASLATMAPRLMVVQRGKQQALPGQPPNVVRYLRQYQAWGLAWSASSAALCCYCMCSNEDLVRLIAVTVTSGICGGIVSRVAGTPRYAIAMVAIWLLPTTVAYLFLGPAYWIMAALSLLYLAALASIVRQQYVEMRALIEAEQRSLAAQAALRASEELVQLAMSAGRIGNYRSDLRTRITYYGQEARLIHGLPPGDAPVPFAAWSAMVLPDDMAKLSRAMTAAYVGRKVTMVLDYRFLHPVDGLRHLETRSHITYDEDGSPLQLVGVLIDVTERRLAEAQIAHLANHDPLTALPNRALFRTRLDDALARAERGEPFALLSLDLDHFKAVNDTFGHPTGDSLLQAVTERLRSMTRPSDTVARLGGDEFAILQSDLQRPADPVGLAERVIAALQAPFDVDGQHVVIGASIGIVVAPDDGMDAQTLLSRADVALYAAKAQGRGRHRRFEPHMDDDLQARRTLELDLRRALENHEFELFYQPIVDLPRQRVCGFEALLRWRHPTRGLVPPDDFIPLTEATGLIVPIGAWVLRQACAEAAGWTSGGLGIAVNLSAVQLPGGTLVDTVIDALRQSGLDPRRLELEITETAVLQDTDATLATLHQLKALGVTIAMDDFGTGYSSLGYLKRFPFGKVKIDRSFTSHLADTRESAAIVTAVVDLCSSLNMRSTVEGVETLEQFEALTRIGCNEAQGYYFSRPLPAAEIPAMLAKIQAILGGRGLIESADTRRAGLEGGRPEMRARLQPVSHG